MSASTRTVSPTQRFTGYRPSSTDGVGYWMTIRFGCPRLDRSARAAPGWASVVCVAMPSTYRRRHVGKRSEMIDLPRSSGVLLHITSLPGGRLGREAFRFVDWLSAAGQSWWQVLPLGPPDRYGSPYKARSAFAASPALLGAPRVPVSEAARIDFRERNGWWVEDWIRFGGRSGLDDQVRFAREWAELRAYALDGGVRLVGDVAIYVAPNSADHRAHPELFQTGLVAGAPPDAFSASGQLWGNPLYDWPALRRRGYRWWVQRLRRTLDLFDMARIDHFRGFVAYWAVDRKSTRLN